MLWSMHVKLGDWIANSDPAPLVSIIGGAVMALAVMLLAGGAVMLLEKLFK